MGGGYGRGVTYVNFQKKCLMISKILTSRVKSVPIFSALNMITGDRGEGVILRRHGSRYEHGRSDSLIKIKVWMNKK